MHYTNVLDLSLFGFEVPACLGDLTRGFYSGKYRSSQYDWFSHKTDMQAIVLYLVDLMYWFAIISNRYCSS